MKGGEEMNCKEVQENLSAYLDNILSAEEMILVKRHLDECNDCREELKILQETVEKLSSLEEKIPPISFRQELFKKLEQSTRKETYKKKFSLRHFVNKVISNKRRPAVLSVAVSLVLLVLIIPFLTDIDMPSMNSSMKSFSNATDSAEPEQAMEKLDESAYLYSIDGGSAPRERNFESKSKSFDRSSSNSVLGTKNEMNIVDKQAKVQEAPTVEQKIIKNADLTIAVDDYDRAVVSLKDTVIAMEGYVTNESLNVVGSQEIKRGYINIKIPQFRFDEFLAGMDDLGKVKNCNISAQDVTEEYVDVESRLKAMRTKEERLLSILTTSGKLSDVLAVENELANTRGQLESMQGRLRYLDNRTDYSTLNINIQQVVTSTTKVSASGLKGVLLKSKEGFIHAINDVLTKLGKLVVFISSAIPYLVVVTLLVVIVWGWTRRKKMEDEA